MERLLSRPSIVEQFNKLRLEQYPPPAEVSPLVVQAQAFASHLDGPPVLTVSEVAAAPLKVQRSAVSAPRAKAVPSAKFTLEGTSYYEKQPERSIALICEPGSPERNQYWVREGERLGHFVIHRIGNGVVVYREN